ncbi:TonB-dependent receptor plug domain-containing protein [Niabella ginsengisoli]|uniref:TonB-dependent receptor plug domain-containing protein n=1 Tax=Niabella ginsengisoli TaxID=522298 RepID=A0ABS9SEV0_9BACT|nr:TonB-dependent receptor plug domain-containing protein [Niabella ginsengisoli]
MAGENKLDEVVVVGYGTQKKRDLTGAVASVDMTATQDVPNTNVLGALRGAAPGLNIGSTDRPGENPSLSIRGQNSITAGNSPLIILDGIIFNGSLNEINPNDVQTIDVLKDASAAAVYGSRSANGVIIITSKKGASGKPVFNVSANYGTSNPVKLIPTLTPDQYIKKYWITE